MLDESNGDYDVYVNLISSPAGIYLSRRPYIVGILKEILAKKKLRGKRIVIEQDMGRGIGTTDVVSTSDQDTIYYAQAFKTDVYSRFAKNRLPQVSNTLTVIAEQDEDGNYEISDTWVGPNRPAFPGDSHESGDSRVFWESHALVHNAVSIQTKSVTKKCPY